MKEDTSVIIPCFSSILRPLLYMHIKTAIRVETLIPKHNLDFNSHASPINIKIRTKLNNVK